MGYEADFAFLILRRIKLKHAHNERLVYSNAFNMNSPFGDLDFLDHAGNLVADPFIQADGFAAVAFRQHDHGADSNPW